MLSKNTITENIIANKHLLANLITNLQFEKHPELETRYGMAGRIRCTEDAVYHLTYLAESINIGSERIFSYYLQWAQAMLQARKIPLDDLLNNLNYTLESCILILPGQDIETITSYIKKGITSLQNQQPQNSFLVNENPLLAEAKQYLALLVIRLANRCLLAIMFSVIVFFESINYI